MQHTMDEQGWEAGSVGSSAGASTSRCVRDHDEDYDRFGVFPPYLCAESSAGGASEGGTSEEGGLGIMEAFESFNLRAEKRVQELIAATNDKLFTADFDTPDKAEALVPPSTPSYILMSDQYRLTKPPEFHHWRRTFPYFQLVGKSSFDEAPDEHIQMRQPLSIEKTDTRHVAEEGGDGNCHPIHVFGKRIRLQIDSSDPPQEELLIADGEMEEILEEDKTDSDDLDIDIRPGTDDGTMCPSPRSSRVEEQIDALAINCFVSMVPPRVASIFETMLRRQQLELRTARKTEEEAARLAHERDLALKEEQRQRAEQEASDRARHEEAVAKLAEEQRIQEELRREELLRQQREENDEDEIKIRTLAYTHQREWYQPQKKCFSHRGRKMTYLKPVLKAQEEAEADSASSDSLSTTVPVRPRRSRGASIRRVSSPSTNDVIHARPSTFNLSSPQHSSRSRPSSSSSSHQREHDAVHLPYLPPSHPKSVSEQETSDTLRRKPTWRVTTEASAPHRRAMPSSTVAAPTRVYGTSPYRIPPAILKSELTRDAVATDRQKRRRKHKQSPQRHDE